jgi:hypothetical protein
LQLIPKLPSISLQKFIRALEKHVLSWNERQESRFIYRRHKTHKTAVVPFPGRDIPQGKSLQALKRSRHRQEKVKKSFKASIETFGVTQSFYRLEAYSCASWILAVSLNRKQNRA